jgi:alkyldihydroxyacetonephosphate synthase
MSDHPERRWNGWGDPQVEYLLSDSALMFLAQEVGVGSRISDASFAAVQAGVPSSRLPPHPLISLEASDRLTHARGQSLPDWIALRSGRIAHFPDGVAYPTDPGQIRSLLDYAREANAILIPYGGGTSVLGHINPIVIDQPNLTVDMRGISTFIELDKESRLATFGAGVDGPRLEAALNREGYTLGHFPQSWEYSTLGGWIATRSCGQQSLRYGRIEDLLAGVELETPVGKWTLDVHPASAAGPDLRQLALGSEGRLGIITQASIRVRPLPSVDTFYAAFFRSWESGLQAVQTLAQSRIGLSMLRLSDPQETRATLALSGLDHWAGIFLKGLRTLGFGPDRCMLVYSLTGDGPTTDHVQRQVRALLRANHALFTGRLIGRVWARSRFRTPYLRNTLWELGYALDTLETATTWSQLPQVAIQLRSSLSSKLESGEERILLLIHLSHVYPDGASLYLTYLFPRKADPDQTLACWRELKTAANDVIQAAGATISHQHGVGIDHVNCLPREKGRVGVRLLREIFQTADPTGMMNPGKLIDIGS